MPWVSNLKEQMRRALTKPEDIEKQIITEIPEMERLIRIWNNAELGYFELTSIGIVIGHANWKQMGTGPIVDLDSAFPSSDA
ncbi:hypothetical protein A5683_13865 [Mycobacterium mantenii]|uniref:Uncharacterized protein n=1 Tax=Mycobacterium mantenii TaxID=560555 RepID=A0A1A2TXW4_MYCNT|nr:hypothetical protein A5688_07360 [Mycobacterium mantenii]OBH81358.1 hypothetical protein A5683_13865 [Mycobacterium mantenii]